MDPRFKTEDDPAESFGLNAVNDGVLLWVDALSRFSPSHIAHKTVVLKNIIHSFENGAILKWFFQT